MMYVINNSVTAYVSCLEEMVDILINLVELNFMVLMIPAKFILKHCLSKQCCIIIKEP